MKILVAPNEFKHSISALEAAEAISQGLQQSQLSVITNCFPIGDGGDGTGDILINYFNGAIVNTEVSDPLGRKIQTTFGLIENGNTAIIEMAKASGLKLLEQHELNPLYTTSFGTGQQIEIALNMGVKKIILGMGGSATVDGGCGILQALGIRFYDRDSKELKQLPYGLQSLHHIDTSGLHKGLNECEIIVLCDVENKLLGQNGAANVFGPQKGASLMDVKVLEAGLIRLSIAVKELTGKNMATVNSGGAAGGAAAGLFAFINAKLVNGIDYFLELTGFKTALLQTDLLVTGEGSIDEQTLQGKAPVGVAKIAKANGIPVIALAGKVPLQINEMLNDFFDVLIPISHEPLSMQGAFLKTKNNLIRTGFLIGNMLSIQVKACELY